MRPETDKELYQRINKEYAQWGAFLTYASKCRGQALDDCAQSIGLNRRQVEERA